MIFFRVTLAALLCLFAFPSVRAQQPDTLALADFEAPFSDAGVHANPPVHSQLGLTISKPRLFTFFATLAAIDVIGYFRLKQIQYRSLTTSFHFLNIKNDFEKNRQMDKIGHLIHASYISDLSYRAYTWSGIPTGRAILYSSLTGWLWMLQIEIADGFFARWGFSWGDLFANSLGVAWSALQKSKAGKLHGVQLKISYHQSNAFKDKQYSSVNAAMIDDYEGMTFWLAFNIYDLLPTKWQAGYPKWLSPVGISVGQSARGIAKSVFAGEREIYFGLDLDLRKIPFARENRFMKFLGDEINFIRLPLPAVRITQGGKWFGVYF